MHGWATCSLRGSLGSLIPQTLCNSLHCPSSQANSQISVVYFCCSLQFPSDFLRKPFKESINMKFYPILQIAKIELDAFGCWISIPDYLHLTTMSPPQRITCGWPQGPASLYLLKECSAGRAQGRVTTFSSSLLTSAPPELSLLGWLLHKRHEHSWTPATPSPLQRAQFSPLCLWLCCSRTMLHNLEKECLHVSICVVSLAVPQIRNSPALPSAGPLNCHTETSLELHLQSLPVVSCS